MKKKKRPEQTGTLSKHRRGFGFVTTKEEGADIYVSARSMNGAMDGDLVLVELLPQALWGGSPEGVVVKVLQRNTSEVAGTFEKSKRFGFVIPEGKNRGEDIFVPKKDFSGAQRGDKVMVQITRYPDRHNSAEGKITEIISRSGQPGGDVKALIRSCGLRETFPSRVNAEAKAVSKKGVGPEALAGRRDLRGKTVITIDGADSKDFDDAVSAELLPGGNYLLGVHIADVSHYVREGGFLDQEAFKRGTSVYLLDQVAPMLPGKLSNGICSLNPDQDRLTLSVDMEITPRGEVVRHDIYESVIHSRARMVYSDVSDMLEHNDVPLLKKHRDIAEDLFIMDKLAAVLREKRRQRGSLNFDLDEAHISLDEWGRAVSVDAAERRTANRLIEEFMLLANQTVAEHFFWMELPFIYRIHEPPAAAKMEELKTFLNGFGITMKGAADSVHPKTLNSILAQAEGKSYENIVSTVMLRSMQKAFYGTDCRGHFGLALKYYCHFTSPIRRYPDLMIHRIIKAALRGELDEKRLKALKSKVQEAADRSSAAERQAVELERDVEKMKKAEYMAGRTGSIYEGVISGVTGFGLYVQLENTIEGLIRLDSLWDDYYIHDPRNHRLTGERTRKIYTLGQKVTVSVASVSVENREINFALEKDRQSGV